jgi:hypothetical protein
MAAAPQHGAATLPFHCIFLGCAFCLGFSVVCAYDVTPRDFRCFKRHDLVAFRSLQGLPNTLPPRRVG